METDVIIIGGGATGTGIARDLSLRGVRSILVEKDDIASGTTGRNHGLLHSGARYAVKDIDSAVECARENRILKKIARHCIEETGGLFVTLPEDDPSYQDRLMDGCSNAGIKAVEISCKDALAIEPRLNSSILSAIKVPDGTIDPFRLSSANMLSAMENGGKFITHAAVGSIIMKGGAVSGIECVSAKEGRFSIHANIIINAAGIWSQEICSLAGIKLKMLPSKGSMLIVDYRINRTVVNRCRVPSDGDIVVPGDTVSLIGTTSRSIEYNGIDDLRVDDDEIDILIRNGEKLIPDITRSRALRAYAGVRPLLAVPGNTAGRDISRGIVLIDHEERDGLKGLVTIVGGKLMTYRLMAEMASDLVTGKIGVSKKCLTARIPLPGSERLESLKKNLKLFPGISKSVIGSAMYRHGYRASKILKNDKKNYRQICECEMVTEGEIGYAMKSLNTGNITDLRRRTRIGMGPCQGALCTYRCAGLLNEMGHTTPGESLRMMEEFLEERWKGVRPVLWGDGLRESEFTYWIYQGLFGLGNIKNDNDGSSDEI